MGIANLGVGVLVLWGSGVPLLTHMQLDLKTGYVIEHMVCLRTGFHSSVDLGVSSSFSGSQFLHL